MKVEDADSHDDFAEGMAAHDRLERARIALELARLRLERQKTSIEALLKRRELAAPKTKGIKEVFTNPLILAVVGGFITLMSTTIAGRFTASQNIESERTKARQELQAHLIEKFVDNPDPQTVRTNLKFLVDVGLVPDYAESLQSFLVKNPNSSLPSSSTSVPSALPNLHTDDDALELLLTVEGGYVYNPNDPSNEVNRGITSAQLSQFLGHPASHDEIRNLSSDTAKKFYRTKFLTGSVSGLTSVTVKAAYLSIAVNAGPVKAGKFFEAAIGKIDKAPIVQDGTLSPETVQRINAVPSELMIETANCEAAKYYDRLSIQYPMFRKGWMNRLLLFSPAHLTGVCPELQRGSSTGAAAH